MNLTDRTVGKVGFYLTSDLMFSSRVTAAAASQNLSLSVVNSIEQLREKTIGQEVGLVFIDLELIADNVVDSISQVRDIVHGAGLVAYAGHVKESLINQAKAVDIDRVLTRGQFNQHCGALLIEYLDGSI